MQGFLYILLGVSVAFHCFTPIAPAHKVFIQQKLQQPFWFDQHASGNGVYGRSVNN
ncbi:hypothetical protein HMPREF0645_1815 [Hallella bergensis DSM 17361]|uniref:Uncharacterized protein n=1 Tax=Hallella bergensis DSM 17361 TaxID=585502 RepID=D1PXY0_9BACT|nr:hypothetical protein HMPREF0645_1815 [Hallella bergensis DSM 17361]